LGFALQRYHSIIFCASSLEWVVINNLKKLTKEPVGTLLKNWKEKKGLYLLLLCHFLGLLVFQLLDRLLVALPFDLSIFYGHAKLFSLDYAFHIYRSDLNQAVHQVCVNWYAHLHSHVPWLLA
jgi:hypothetical protein